MVVAMIAGIMAVIAFLGQLLALGIKVWDAKKETDLEKKKQVTEILQSSLRAVIDKDVSRLNSANIALKNLNK